VRALLSETSERAHLSGHRRRECAERRIPGEGFEYNCGQQWERERRCRAQPATVQIRDPRRRPTPLLRFRRQRGTRRVVHTPPASPEIPGRRAEDAVLRPGAHPERRVTYTRAGGHVCEPELRGLTSRTDGGRQCRGGRHDSPRDTTGALSVVRSRGVGTGPLTDCGSGHHDGIRPSDRST
jgi:hypothetical protein